MRRDRHDTLDTHIHRSLDPYLHSSWRVNFPPGHWATALGFVGAYTFGRAASFRIYEVGSGQMP